MSNLKEIINNLKSTFDGDAWHGPSLQEVLKDITVEQSLHKIENGHNIAELVHHIYAWRFYVIQHLDGKKDYEVPDDFNFIKIETIEDSQWQALKIQLIESQSIIVNSLELKEEDFLRITVGRREFNFAKLLNGLIHHDVYHAGQIRMLAVSF
ncbi:MAG: putative damage-inducible protein DinB [Saprospiraceae bacterium]|jgi:uncharacterized damage-inducible protein DinB